MREPQTLVKPGCAVVDCIDNNCHATDLSGHTRASRHGVEDQRGADSLPM